MQLVTEVVVVAEEEEEEDKDVVQNGSVRFQTTLPMSWLAHQTISVTLNNAVSPRDVYQMSNI